MKLFKSLIPEHIRIRIKKAHIALIKPTAQLIEPGFYGWGMASLLDPPMKFTDYDGIRWKEDQELMLELVSTYKVKLSQFGNKERAIERLKALQWRHYIVQISIARALNSAKRFQNQLLCSEFGVCDGLTAWFALRKLNRMEDKFKIDLFDSWEGMRDKDLLPSEKDRAGSYEYLDIENTKSNLYEFKSNCKFIKGFVPDTFPKSIPSNNSQWIHIDINNALLTSKILNHYFREPANGSIVLLDDYGHLGFEDTRSEVDKWILDRKERFKLEVFPTGQALIEAI